MNSTFSTRVALFAAFACLIGGADAWGRSSGSKKAAEKEAAPGGSAAEAVAVAKWAESERKIAAPAPTPSAVVTRIMKIAEQQGDSADLVPEECARTAAVNVLKHPCDASSVAELDMFALELTNCRLQRLSRNTYSDVKSMDDTAVGIWDRSRDRIAEACMSFQASVIASEHVRAELEQIVVLRDVSEGYKGLATGIASLYDGVAVMKESVGGLERSAERQETLGRANIAVSKEVLDKSDAISKRAVEISDRTAEIISRAALANSALAGLSDAQKARFDEISAQNTVLSRQNTMIYDQGARGLEKISEVSKTAAEIAGRAMEIAREVDGLSQATAEAAEAAKARFSALSDQGAAAAELEKEHFSELAKKSDEAFEQGTRHFSELVKKSSEVLENENRNLVAISGVTDKTGELARVLEQVYASAAASADRVATKLETVVSQGAETLDVARTGFAGAAEDAHRLLLQVAGVRDAWGEMAVLVAREFDAQKARLAEQSALLSSQGVQIAANQDAMLKNQGLLMENQGTLLEMITTATKLLRVAFGSTAGLAAIAWYSSASVACLVATAFRATARARSLSLAVLVATSATEYAVSCAARATGLAGCPAAFAVANFIRIAGLALALASVALLWAGISFCGLGKTALSPAAEDLERFIDEALAAAVDKKSGAGV